MAWLTPPLLWLEIIVAALVCWCVYRYKKQPGSRIVSWLAYIAIGVGLVLGITLNAFYWPDKSPVDWKWVAFAINTTFVFGYVMKCVRPLWAKPTLWTVVAGLLLLHGIIGWFVISRFEQVPLLWYVPVDLAEIWAVLVAVQLACRALLPAMQKR